MASAIRILITIAVASLCFFAYADGFCNFSALYECLRTAQASELAGKIKSASEMGDWCGVLDDAFTCAHQYYPDCDPFLAAHYQGASDANTYMCYDGLEAYMTYQQCITAARKDRHGPTSCKVKSGYDPEHQIPREACSSGLNLISCTTRRVEQECMSHDAVSFIRTYSRKEQAPTFKLLNCTAASSHMSFMSVNDVSRFMKIDPDMMMTGVSSRLSPWGMWGLLLLICISIIRNVV